MTNEKLSVILATVLDMAKNDRQQFGNTLKRFALAQAYSAEESLTEDEHGIVIAAATLYNVYDEDVAAPKAGDNNFKPIVSPKIIATILEDLYIPSFESSAIRSLVGLREHDLDIENKLHRILKEIDTLALLTEENDPAKIAASAELFTTETGKRRYNELFA